MWTAAVVVRLQAYPMRHPKMSSFTTPLVPPGALFAYEIVDKGEQCEVSGKLVSFQNRQVGSWPYKLWLQQI